MMSQDDFSGSLPEEPQQQPHPGGNYPAVGAVIIGLAAGVALAAVTQNAAYMIIGLAAGAADAVWLGWRARP
jgi:hypothetical protein